MWRQPRATRVLRQDPVTRSNVLWSVPRVSAKELASPDCPGWCWRPLVQAPLGTTLAADSCRAATQFNRRRLCDVPCDSFGLIASDDSGDHTFVNAGDRFGNVPARKDPSDPDGWSTHTAIPRSHSQASIHRDTPNEENGSLWSG